jgi:diguanylate cyclase (GGDEF)-like protein
VAGALRRVSDLAARYGGEEFALILPDTDLAGAARVAERVRDTVAQLRIAHEDSPAGLCISISGGVAVTLGTATETAVQELIAAADEALYQAKHLGRDRMVCHSDASATPNTLFLSSVS